MQPCSLTLARDRGSAARHRAVRSQGLGRAKRSAARRRCSTGCRACSTMPGSPGATSSRRTDWYMQRPRLARSQRRLSRSRRAAVRRGGARSDRQGRPDARPDRRRRHRLDHRHRHPEPRSARSGRGSGFAPDVRRVPVFGLGCAGGVNGLALAARLAAADPGSHWLFVTVETCSISIRLDSDDPAAVVATALFGDGAAAAVVTSGEHSLARITGSAEKLWPDTLRHHGLGRRGPGPGRRLRPRDPAVHRGRAGRGRRRDVREARHRPRRHRPLLLPSRRSEGDRRDRNARSISTRASSTSSARCCATTAT